MKILSLSASAEAKFYRQQVSVLRDIGVEVTSISVPKDASTESNVRTPLQYFKFVPMVIKKAQSEFDVVHANYGLTAPAALAQVNHPVVLSLWGSDLVNRVGLLSRLSAALCDEVVVMSDRMATSLDQPCHVIPHGIDLDRFEPIEKTRARDEISWPTDCRIVFFPYPEDRQVKNYQLAQRVVNAADSLLDADIELRTVSGIPHDRMQYYYSGADALLLTSKREGSPNSVKEAMACNCPVVSTNVGDVPERLAGTTPSSVCDSEAELVEKLVPILRDGNRSNGREQIRSVTIEDTGRQLKSLYNTVAD